MSEPVFAESQRRWRENCTLKTKIESLERQLEEVREERDYLATGIEVRDNMIRSLQEECVKLQLQIPIEPFKIKIKEKGDE